MYLYIMKRDYHKKQNYLAVDSGGGIEFLFLVVRVTILYGNHGVRVSIQMAPQQLNTILHAAHGPSARPATRPFGTAHGRHDLLARPMGGTTHGRHGTTGHVPVPARPGSQCHT